MLLNYAFFLTLLLTSLAVVKAEDEDEREQKIAKAISENICKDEDRSKDWYDCIMCCQGMNPYKLEQTEEDIKKAQSDLYGGSDLAKDTKQKVCDNMNDYSTKLKEVVVDWKGDIKTIGSTEDGMKDFFQAKMDCFLACEEDPPNKSKCKQ